MIRVLHVVPNMQAGGLETFIMNVYRNIDRNKVQFDFLVHYKEDFFYDEEIKKMGGKIYKFSLRNDKNLFKYIKDLNKFFYEHKEYKIVHCHMSSIGAVLFRILKKQGVKVRIAHSHNSTTEKSIKGVIKRIMMYPYKRYSNVNYACSQNSGIFLFGKRMFEIIPNAIDVDKFYFDEIVRKRIREELGVKEEYVIGHVGRFNVQKNHVFIINMFKTILNYNKSLKLILIGDGELKSDMIKLVEENNLEKNIIFIGNKKNVYDYYQAMDLFILPSLFEGLPVTGIEAQVNGLPCIFSNKVTKEVDISQKSIFLELEIDKWCEIILQQFDNKKRFVKDYSDSEFNIKRLALDMQKKYEMMDNI